MGSCGQHHAAVDGENLAGGERVGHEVQVGGGYFCGGGDSPQRHARGEGGLLAA